MNRQPANTAVLETVNGGFPVGTRLIKKHKVVAGGGKIMHTWQSHHASKLAAVSPTRSIFRGSHAGEGSLYRARGTRKRSHTIYGKGNIDLEKGKRVKARDGNIGGRERAPPLGQRGRQSPSVQTQVLRLLVSSLLLLISLPALVGSRARNL
jgi:hypothetical protein